jgi:hypothetical protein
MPRATGSTGWLNGHASCKSEPGQGKKESEHLVLHDRRQTVVWCGGLVVVDVRCRR